MRGSVAKKLRKAAGVGNRPTTYRAVEVLDKKYKKKTVIVVDNSCPRGIYQLLKKMHKRGEGLV
jgi:hypothetical protein